MNNAASQLVVISVDDLRRLIASEVRDALAANTVAPATQSEWLTPEQLAKELGYDRRTIPTLVRRRGLPCHRVGRKLRFKRVEVNAWIEQHGSK